MNDKRLLACAALCSGRPDGRAADVGTDHGHLAVYLVQQGICGTAVACDINEKPLGSAKENIRRAGLEDRISTCLSDGLDCVPSEGITDVVIAGMGGELIADIISRADWIRTERVNLVLQPMTKWDHLRQYLWDNGFEVTRELPCTEGRFVYSVMQAVYVGGRQRGECSLAYLYGGLTDGSTEDGRAYLQRQAQRLETAGRGLMRSPDKAVTAQRYLAAARELRERIGG